MENTLKRSTANKPATERVYSRRPSQRSSGLGTIGVGAKELERQRQPLEASYSPNYVPLPAEPTKAPPGSPEKIQMMAARIAVGQDLWASGDADGYDCL